MAKTTKGKVEPIEIDKQALQEARAAARAKAAAVFTDEMAAITKPLRNQLQKLTDRRTALDSELQSVEHDIVTVSKALNDVMGIETPSATNRGSGKRVRRSKDERLADAEKILAYVKAHPGCKAGEVERATNVNFKPSMAKFLADNGGHKVKTDGNKASTTYTLA